MTLSQRIRYYRLLNKFSQDKLGKKIGSDARTISHYENEKYKPSADAVVALANAFEISTDELLIGQPSEVSDDLLQKEWIKILGQIVALPEEDRGMIKKMLKYLISKSKPQQRLTKQQKRLVKTEVVG